MLCISCGAFTIPWALLVKIVFPLRHFDIILQEKEKQKEVPEDEASLLSNELLESAGGNP
jgi:hypothetical protein